MDSSAQSLDFPLTTTNGNAEREREREREREKNLHTTLRSKSAKLEQLRSTRLIRRDPKATNSRHAKTASEIMDSSLLATIINHFKH
jgi:hypothetical protein